MIPEVTRYWLVLLLLIGSDAGSYLGQRNAFMSEGFQDFPQCLQANTEKSALRLSTICSCQILTNLPFIVIILVDAMQLRKLIVLSYEAVCR